MFLPKINSTGTFECAAPFDTVIHNDMLFTVTAIRSLNELITEGMKPFDTIYSFVGLSEVVYKQDLENDVPIIVLQNEATEFVYVPANKIKSIPKSTGVNVVDKVLTVKICGIPQNLDLVPLMTQIGQLTESVIGIKSNIEEHTTSAVRVISYDDAETARIVRNNYANNNDSIFTQLKKKDSQLQDAILEIEKLKECLKLKI